MTTSPQRPPYGFAEAFLLSSRDLHCVVSSGWRVEWAAGAWGSALGVDPGLLVGMPLLSLLHPEDAEMLQACVGRDGSEPDHATTRARCSDGSDRWIAWTGWNGPADGSLRLSGRDVTAAVQYQRDRAREHASALAAASHDPLTGLANRSLLHSHLSTAIARSERSGAPPLVLFLDLDGFKRINDALGHESGDQVLRDLAARLEAAFRPSDLIARFGGDEFVVVIDDGEVQDASERIRAAVETQFHLGEQTFDLRVSIGAAYADGIEPTPAGVIAAADRQMYLDKRARAPLSKVREVSGAGNFFPASYEEGV